ncbi:hypothetical protein AB205_0087310 [Aquarana catesbeiana]|uniref:Uncharacterized protein n=1 Tax=Aquarana catesbeiana TaxID=8400 RepID=A0A2G9Q9N1_AQUCT|nr:hypothetical protein AB205_0087310 [Aquarana catesbeiana]
MCIYIFFAYEPTKNFTRYQWIISRLLQALSPAVFLYKCMHFQLEIWSKCQRTTSVVMTTLMFHYRLQVCGGKACMFYFDTQRSNIQKDY